MLSQGAILSPRSPNASPKIVQDASKIIQNVIKMSHNSLKIPQRLPNKNKRSPKKPFKETHGLQDVHIVKSVCLNHKFAKTVSVKFIRNSHMMLRNSLFNTIQYTWWPLFPCPAGWGPSNEGGIGKNWAALTLSPKDFEQKWLRVQVWYKTKLHVQHEEIELQSFRTTGAGFWCSVSLLFVVHVNVTTNHPRQN